MSAARIADERAELGELVRRLPDSDLAAAKRVLQSFLVDPVWLAIEAAAPEDEELSPEERTALELSDTPAERRQSIPHSEILREFGLEEAN